MQDYNENLTDPFENNKGNIATTAQTNLFLYESGPAPSFLTHSTKPTLQPNTRMISQPINTLIVCQTIFDSIKALKKNAKRQLEQADALKDQLNQLQQSLIVQQQSPMHNRSRVHRTHPYGHPLAASRTPTRPSVSYYHDDKLDHPQQMDVPAAATGFLDNNEFFSASSQEFFNDGNTTYNVSRS